MIGNRKHWLLLIACLLLGMIFLVSGIGQILLKSTSVEYPVFPGILAGGFGAFIHTVLPYIQVIIGVMLIVGVGIKCAVSASFGLAVAFTATNLVMIAQGKAQEDCLQCFGVNGQLTVASSLTMDIFMIGLILVIVLCYRGPNFNLTPLVWAVSPVKNKERNA